MKEDLFVGLNTNISDGPKKPQIGLELTNEANAIEWDIESYPKDWPFGIPKTELEEHR